MKERRAPGGGNVEKLRSGRFRVRFVGADGKRRTLGTFANRAEAEATLNAALQLLADGKMAAVGGVTLRAFGRGFPDRRELEGVRGVATERSRWRVHVESASIADLPLTSITTADIKRWRDGVRGTEATHRYLGRLGRKVSRATVRRVFVLARACFDAAVEDGIITENPTRGLKIPNDKDEQTEDPWTYLVPEEQQLLGDSKAVSEEERDIILFAMYTGLRQGEAWNLELRDVHLDAAQPHVTIRFGSRGKPTKSGKRRNVHLIPRAQQVLHRWLERLPVYAPDNDQKLVFPTPRGCRRQRGKTPKGWKQFLAVANLGRHVRWHDLRHTCGSSLVAGWWGRRWSLEEVRELLGHSTTNVTEMYAHLAESELGKAAAATHDEAQLAATVAKETGSQAGPRSVHGRGAEFSEPACFPQRAPSDSNGRPTDSKSVRSSQVIPGRSVG